MAASSSRAPRRFRMFLASRKAMLGAVFPRARLRRWLVVTVTLITILMGPNGLLTTLPLAYAASPQSALSKGHPNHFDPTQDAQSLLHLRQNGHSDPNWKPPKPQHLLHTPPPSMKPGSLALTPGKAAQFLGSDGRLEVDVPAPALLSADLTGAGGKLTLQITQIAPASGSSAGGSGLISFGTYLLQLVDVHGKRVNHGFRVPITVKLHYLPQESALDLAHTFVVWNTPLPQGVQLTTPTNASVPNLGIPTTQNATLDSKAHTLTVSPLISTPGTDLSWDTDAPVAAFGAPDPFTVDLNAGALTMSYPINLPPGAGGFTPPVSLSYSSAAVSEQHGPQGAAPWVGEGWSLSLGSISWSEQNVTAGCSTCSANWEDKWQLNDPFGTSAELIPPNINVSTFTDDTGNSITPSPIFWQTAPATHAKVISFTGPNAIGGTAAPCFRVFLTNGIMEEFGCTPDSLTYYINPSGANQGKPYLSSWLLDLITDRNGNQIHLTYQWDSQTGAGGQTYPRAAELATIEYDSPTCQQVQMACTGSAWAPQMRVNFVASHTPARLTNSPANCNTGSNLRCDDPLDLSGSGGLVAPTVQSTFVLNDIQVQVRTSGSGSWNTLHDYQLSYEQNGPSAITDPTTGKQESVAGMLDLTQIQAFGDDGTTSEPTRVFGYTTLTEHYEDDAYHPNPSTNCGPSWNSSACLLWSQSYAGNSRYLATADNGLGLQQVFSWAEGRNNTHGVNGGGSNTANPLYCDGKEGQGYPCSQADDQNWSHAVLTQETDSVLRVSQNGQGGQQTSTSVDSTTAYGYQLTYPLLAQPCSDCVAGMYWGNQNDADFLDYYNNHFMGFAQTTVAHPDGSVDVHHYDATEGWGIYDTNQVHCFSINPCHNDPWWDLTNAAHGHEVAVESYDTNGTTLLKETRTQYQALCPPNGVSGTPAYASWGNWNGNLVSELDHNNPVASCDIQTTQVDTYTFDGSTSSPLVTYTASAGFSATQGLNQWRYQYSTDGETTFQDMTYDSTNARWAGSETNCLVGSNWQHPGPNVCDSVRTWIAPSAGVAALGANGSLTVAANCGSSQSPGVYIRVLKNGAQIWPTSGWQFLTHGDWFTFPTLSTSVAAGDRLQFVEKQDFGNQCDTTTWDPTITLAGGSALHQTTSYIYDSYGRVLTTTSSSDDGGSPGSPSTLVTHTVYVWNDAITATATGATGAYLIAFPAYTYTDDGSGNRTNCTYTSYDGLIDEIGPQSNFTGAGKATRTDRYTTLSPTTCGYQGLQGFSATQGQNQWRYQYSTDGENTFQDMTYNGTNGWWQGSEATCLVAANSQHPGASGCDSVRTWVAPGSGTVTLNANGLVTLLTGCSQVSPAAHIRVLKNGTQLWPTSGWQLLQHNSSIAFPTLTLSVAAGDQLHFVLAQVVNNQCDATVWDPQVDFASAGGSTTPTFAHTASPGQSFTASAGFSTTQGQNQWRYQYSNDGEATLQDMTYNSANSWWQGSEANCLVASNWQLPGPSTCDAVRTWVAPSSGTVMLTTNGPISEVTGCSQMSPGADLRLMKNGTPLWPATGWQFIQHGATLSMPPLLISIAAGDHLQLVVHETGGNGCDFTFWDLRVTYTEGWIETTTTYDSYGNPLTTTDADANAGVAGHTGCTVGSSQYSTCTAYDTTFQSLTVSKTNALNQTEQTGYTQNAGGGFGLWPTSTTDVNGQTTTYGYDGLGRMTSRTLPGETTGLTTTTWSYTDFCAASGAQSPCLEIDETQRLNSATTITTRAFYDGFGRLVELRSPGPNGQDVVHYRYYDPSGQSIFESIQYFVAAYTGAPGAAAYSIPDSTQAGTTTTYDGMGRVTSKTDALSNRTTTSYTVVCGTISGDSACYEQGLVVDPLLHQQATLGDAMGRKIYDQRYTGNSASTYHVYATTTYTYDETANLTQILHPDGATKTSFQFDLAGRQIGLIDPDRGAESYMYDADGNRIESIDARGASGTVYSGYDGLDRQLWRSSHSDGSSPYATYTYDSTANGNHGIGHVTGETFTNGTLSGSYSYVYDQRGQQISNTLTVGSASYTVQTTYDDASNVLTQTYPDGEGVTNTYTAEGWLSGVATQVGSTTIPLLSNASYSGVGGAGHLITGASLDSGIYQYATSYDLLLRLTDAKYTRLSDGATLYEEARSFDGAGNVTSEAKTLPQGTDQQQFCYDEQNRLTWAGSVGTPPCTGTAITPGTLTAANYTQGFSYDTLGRLTSGPLGSYTYGASAHVHAATSISSVYTATYDAAGNETCRAPTSATTCAGSTPTGAQLSYDNEGRLTAWQNAPSSPTATDSFLYDGEGNRIAQQATQSGSTTTTVYVGNLEEAATTSSTTTTTTYYYAGGQRIALAVNGAFSYLATDATSSVSVAFDANGNLQASQLFTPYGGIRYSTGTMPGTYSFTGQRADGVTGLDYYQARYYDPNAGQFTSADTMLPGKGFDPWGLSRYAYVEGNPISRTDPSGHGWFDSIVNTVSNVVQTVAPVVSTVLDATTGIPSMINDVKTVFSGNTSVLDKVFAAGDLLMNVAMDASMVVGVGEGLRAAYVGAKVVEDVGMHALEDAGEHALEDTGEHALEDTGEHGASCGLSFSADTLVATPSGEQAISTLHVGDLVLAYDPQTHQVSTQTVLHVWINHDTDLLDVTVQTQDAASGQAATPATRSRATKGKLPAAGAGTEHQGQTQGSTGASATHDETIHTTANHPWLTADQGWITAGQLKVGEPVLRADGKLGVVVAIRVVPGAGTMYDLEVNHIHTFVVGSGEYIVHNCGDNLPDGWTKEEFPDEQYDPSLDPAYAPEKTPLHRPGLDVTFNHDTGELTIDWLEKSLTPLRHIGPLVDALGDQVTKISGHITTGLKASFGSNMWNKLMNAADAELGSRGFTGGVIQTGEQIWIEYTR